MKGRPIKPAPTIKKLRELAQKLFPNGGLVEHWSPVRTQIHLSNSPHSISFSHWDRKPARLLAERVLYLVHLGTLCDTFGVTPEVLLDGETVKVLQQAIRRVRDRKASDDHRSTASKNSRAARSSKSG